MTRKGLSGLIILLGLAAGMAAAAAAPFYWAASLEPQIAEKSEMLALLERKMNSAGKNVKSVRIDTDAVYVKGTTPGLAGAELQRIVAELAQASGMKIEKLEVLPAEERDGATVLRLDVDTVGTIVALRDYLHAIETGAPLIFVREAHIGVDKLDNEDVAVLPSERLSVGLQLEAVAWWNK